jgi:hypothetical protein
MALGERFTRSAVACEFSFSTFSWTALAATPIVPRLATGPRPAHLTVGALEMKALGGGRPEGAHGSTIDGAVEFIVRATGVRFCLRHFT